MDLSLLELAEHLELEAEQLKARIVLGTREQWNAWDALVHAAMDLRSASAWLGLS